MQIIYYQSVSSSSNRVSIVTPNTRAIFRASRVEGLNLPCSMATMVWRGHAGLIGQVLLGHAHAGAFPSEIILHRSTPGFVSTKII